ncbi:putative transcriptional regulator [Elusimicrobium minutum Pei191]|uniref:Putative transcriptional regulator n=1 Tax=Elusimicrobium minutum (strain Pei191) TaxID=445932 RepID=B2KEZ3_ELUMP|nr:ParB/RepB/Spo0J family partition protein [Elusimicrobium minutum]ACC99089.1 putative transcriptional regulator [Elusimicrobium minutum Pei191]
MSRQALGKGLDALLKQTQEVLGTKDTAVKAGANIQKIPLTSIVPNRFQPRRTFNEETLKELAESIKQHGLTQPIVVVFDAGLNKYEIVVGERRFRATKLAGFTEIEAIVHSSLGDKEMSALALIENIQREDLNPIETALGYKSLMQKFHVSQTDLAGYCGKSKAAISNSLRLLDLSKEIQKTLEEGILSEGHGRALLMVPDLKKREILFIKLKSGKFSVRQAEQAAREIMTVKTSAPAQRPVEVVDFENNLQKALGTKVEVKYGKSMKKGSLVIQYNSLEQLENIADRLKSKML